ncbi:putative divalent cation/proton antiporter TMEM165 isoform X1 [Macrobrachium nipponense]|uniref:putative divalent cation/proton antiporter TMEM165 isoform X1 n=2 Tax=Macrobrachium nipponense TaxID=159736 RepID=UPI0030C8A5DB
MSFASTMLRLSWVVALATLACIVIAEIQPIDVEPVVKREQPDFERSKVDQALPVNKSITQDDTGNGPPVPGDLAPNASSGDSDKKDETAVSFTSAFVSALSMIIVTELGDKTFFIAAIMAMNHPRLTVFAGAMTALAIMHVLSAMFGYVITWIPRVYTFYASSVLFAIFGLKMLREGWNMKPEEGQEEFEEVQSDLRRREDDARNESRNENTETEAPSVSVQMTVEGDGQVTSEEESKEKPEVVFKQDSDNGDEASLQKEPLEEGGAGLRGRGPKRNKILARILTVVSRVFWQALTLTFLAEWGDRSQIATVVMAAREDVYGVIVGGLLGHFLCTGLGVLGGRMIATKISVRTVTIIGGVTFLIFAVSALIMGP